MGLRIFFCIHQTIHERKELKYFSCIQFHRLRRTLCDMTVHSTMTILSSTFSFHSLTHFFEIRFHFFSPINYFCVVLCTKNKPPSSRHSILYSVGSFAQVNQDSLQLLLSNTPTIINLIPPKEFELYILAFF